jgi:hypothetical protein
VGLVLEVEEGLGSEAYAATHIVAVAEAEAVARADAILLRDGGAHGDVGTVATLIVYIIFGLSIYAHYAQCEGESHEKLSHS